MKPSIAILALIATFLLSPLSLADKGPALKDYPAEQVTDNVYVIHGPLGMPNPENQGFMNNPAFVITKDGIVVIDPGSSVQTGEMLLRVMAKISDKPVIAVFNTHIHGDHWLGNQAIRAAYPNVPIYGHTEMLAMIKDGAGDTWIELMDKLTEGATKGTLVVGPDNALNHGDTIKVGNKTFRIHHHGQAHTRTDLMIEVVEDNVVFLGDNVTTNRIPRMTDGNFTGNINSVDRILEVEATTWIPGHGNTGDTAMVKGYREYLAAVYASAKQAFDTDMDSSDVKPIALKATAAYKDWSGYEDEIGPQGAQAYMEVEAAEF